MSLKQYLIFSISIMEKTVSLLRVEVRPGKTVSGIKNCFERVESAWTPTSCICGVPSFTHEILYFCFSLSFLQNTLSSLFFTSVFSQLSLMQLFVSLHVYCNLPPTLICLHSGVAVFTRDPLANPNIDIMLV